MKAFITFILGCGGGLFAQTDSRVAEISAQQEQKAAEVKPVQRTGMERLLLRFSEQGLFQKFLNGGNGFTPRFGGMAPESGIGLGPGYTWKGKHLTMRTGAVVSTRGSRKFDIVLAAPNISGTRFFAQVNAVHHDYRRLSFYGSGPDSEKTSRARYNFEDTAVDATFGVRPIRHLAVGTSAGYVANRMGSLPDDNFTRPDDNFTRISGFAQYDWRDNPSGPRRGGNYFTQISDYGDFRRLDMEAQQFVSILNQRRVFAVRAKSTMTYKDAGYLIPFYMQPMLGGSDDLRGFRPYRFRGDNSMVMNAEYRWEIFTGLDMALFADAGKVFNRKSDFDFRNLESNVGFGFRGNARNKTFLRLDVAFSHEGFQVWVKFNNIFTKGPIQTSSSMGDF